jgi:hypothetical protein
MADGEKPSSKRHEEGQGPASLHQQGPAAGASLKDLGQPTRSQNADAVMQEHFDHPKWHKH